MENDEFQLEDYRTLVHALDLGVVLHDRSGAIVAANSAASRLLGLTHEQLLGRDSMDPRWMARRENGEPLPGEDHPAMVTLRTGVDADGVVMHIARPQGDRVWLSVTTRALFRDHLEDPSHVAVTFRDITEEFRARREREQHRLAFEHVGIGAVIISFERRGRIVFCNRAYAEMLGRTADELVGLNVDDLTHPGDIEKVTAAMGALLVGAMSTVSLEVRSLRADGAWIWTLSFATLVRDDEGKPLYGIAQTIDITERKNADEKLNTYIAQISDIVAVLDASGVMQYVSPGVTQVLGLTPAEVTGLNVFDFVHPDERELAAEAATNTARRPGTAPPLQLRLRNVDGQYRTLELVANNKLNDPAIRGLVITARDVTDRLAIEQQLRDREREFERLAARRQRERLEVELARSQRLESLGRLAGGIAHDFNNLLGVILNYSTLLQRRPELDPQAHADVDSVRRAAERGADLVRRLLQFSRRDIRQVERLDVSSVVRDVARLLERTLGVGIELRTEANAQCWIEADRGQIEQVLINLVLNARDAIHGDGRITVRVETIEAVDPRLRDRVVREGAFVVLTVEDDGEGMATDVLGRAFEPFFTTKPHGEGTGLGLSSVYGIVDSMSGHVWIESTVDEGTTVSVAFAIDAREGDRVDERLGAVLVVDDEIDVAEMVARILSDEGWTVDVATSGVAALDAIRSGQEIDVLLTDFSMPGMSGLDLADAVRVIAPGLPIVVMSGFAPERSQIETVELDGLIAKPFDRDDLVRVLRRALRT
jgi:PAS domain S-box-containing protein